MVPLGLREGAGSAVEGLADIVSTWDVLVQELLPLPAVDVGGAQCSDLIGEVLGEGVDHGQGLSG